MGTRADFYVGMGTDAEWLGSIAFDGYPDGDAVSLLPLTDERAFRQGVTNLLGRDDATTPDLGWPWPWDDSRTTDYSYSFDGEKVAVHSFGRPVTVDAEGNEGDTETEQSKAEFPNMAERKAVTFGHRSGAMFLSFPAQPS